jgi:hypothetical protein
MIYRTCAVLQTLSGLQTTSKFTHVAPQVTSHAAIKRKMPRAKDPTMLFANIQAIQLHKNTAMKGLPH